VIFEEPEGATRLTSDEAAGLVPPHIQTRSALNEWEQANILEAERWAAKAKVQVSGFYREAFIKKVHKRMFDQTWSWAGQYRQTNKNIGVNAGPMIGVEIYKLSQDVEYWINEGWTADEIAMRFHHRLVWIHPFANGNGRHARLMADICLRKLNTTPFSWGMKALSHPNRGINEASSIRSQYIDALRQADSGDFSALSAFVRS
jgi:Fic-DOC domain mobile mystery protein B